MSLPLTINMPPFKRWLRIFRVPFGAVVIVLLLITGHIARWLGADVESVRTVLIVLGVGILGKWDALLEEFMSEIKGT